MTKSQLLKSRRESAWELGCGIWVFLSRSPPRCRRLTAHLEQLLRLGKLCQRELELRVALREVQERGRDAKHIGVDLAANHRLDEVLVLLPRRLIPLDGLLHRHLFEL